MADISLVLKDVTKTFPERNGGIFNAVDKVNIEVAKGEMVTFLGPSGCGKTTTLRMIAGFVIPTSGSITIEGKDMTSVPVNERAIGFVFQNYALFPHMTIYKNVGYGLKARGEKDADIHDKIINALKLVGLSGGENRYPNQLSGGEQQRVALARVIVMEPSLLLMDEPLSNLDAKLRIEMRSAIRDVQKQIGITTVYVTHDQEEALAVSDRIAVMKDGHIQQIGTPEEIYARPYNAFVSTFIGHSNLFYGTIKKGADVSIIFAGGYEIPMTNLSDAVQDGQKVVVSVRPEEFAPSDKGFECKVTASTFLGKYTNYFLEFPAEICVENQPSIEFSQDLGHAERVFRPGDALCLKPNAAKINVFTEDMEMPQEFIKGDRKVLSQHFDDEKIVVEINGDGFLYKMVRNIVGTMVEVGLGKMKPEDIRRAIDSRDRTLAGHTAPPQGLYLKEIFHEL